MHRFRGHLFDLTDITSGTSNFDLTPKVLLQDDERRDISRYRRRDIISDMILIMRLIY